MSSLFKTTLNTRFLPTEDKRYIRSDCPANLTDDEVEWLSENGYTTVVDLREKSEYEKRPCRLESEDGFEYFHYPISFGGKVPDSADEVSESYIKMIDSQMVKIIDTLMGAPGRAIYFCAGGKDRTGVVSAIMLKKYGVGNEIIIKDYMETKANLYDLLKKMSDEHPEIKPEVIFPKEENIIKVLEFLESEAAGELLSI